MTDHPDQRQHQMRMIYDQSKGAHHTSKQLLPLLNLLEPPEGQGSLDEIKALLTTIVQILGQHSDVLTELKARIERAGPSPTGQQ